MKLIFDLEGDDEIAAALSGGVDDFAAAMRTAVLHAGDAAIREMQANHPYTDRTYLLSGGMKCKPGRQSRQKAEALVTFLAPYANIVNDGSVKTRPYPFVPQGLRAAEIELERCVNDALTVFCNTLG